LSIDWEAVREEVTGYLQALLQMDTTNPPGNEIVAAEYLSDILQKEGFEPVVTESEPGRGNVTARMTGGSQPALMLLGHTDVVAVEPDKWTHSPFGGEIHDGQIWGRGALDMKGMVAAELMVFLLLKRQGAALNRDLVYGATADEEAGKGNHGVGWLMDTDPAQVEATYVITEGGGSEFELGGARFCTCQTGQKGIFRFRMIARGHPGHGSVPHSDNAVVKLSKAVAALGAPLPIHPSETLTAFMEGIAKTQEAATARLLRHALSPELSAATMEKLPFSAKMKASLGSLMRNTVSPTILDAGTKINVIPAEATAWVDGRLAPGQSDVSFLAEIRPLIGEEIEVVVDQYSPPLEASPDSPLFKTIVDTMAEHDPDVIVLPSLTTGGTDAKHMCPRRPDMEVLGFMPHRPTVGKDEDSLIHGHDERVSVDNLLRATRILYDVTCRFCGVS